MASVYHINKGINRPIVFKGFVGQYIAYLAVGLVLLLIAFAVLYVSGVSLFLVLPIILGLGAGLIFLVMRLSKRFGQHGLSKYLARRKVPAYLRFSSRRLFTALSRPGLTQS